MSNHPKSAYLGRNSKLLCPECSTVQPVTSHEDHIATLSCSHSRTEELLPAHGVSIEAILNHDPLAAQFWPPSKESWKDKTEKLLDESEMTAIREGWRVNERAS